MAFSVVTHRCSPEDYQQPFLFYQENSAFIVFSLERFARVPCSEYLNCSFSFRRGSISVLLLFSNVEDISFGMLGTEFAMWALL